MAVGNIFYKIGAMKMIEFLKESAEKSEIILSGKMLEKFRIFYEELLETNKTLNLTAITEMHEVVLKHFIDSMAVSKFYDLSNKFVMDVGTGAGFPGVPLAILFPSTKFVLLDSLKKRLNFIDKVLEKCDIGNIELLHGRAEDFGRDIKYREQFDFCVSRAVAAMPVLLELCIPFVKVGGKFISYKSERLGEELGSAGQAMKILNCRLSEEYEYKLPGTDIYRVYAAFEKEKNTSKKYPRQAGKPKKNPL